MAEKGPLRIAYRRAEKCAELAVHLKQALERGGIHNAPLSQRYAQVSQIFEKLLLLLEVARASFSFAYHNKLKPLKDKDISLDNKGAIADIEQAIERIRSIDSGKLSAFDLALLYQEYAVPQALKSSLKNIIKKHVELVGQIAYLLTLARQGQQLNHKVLTNRGLAWECLERTDDLLKILRQEKHGFGAGPVSSETLAQHYALFSEEIAQLLTNIDSFRDMAVEIKTILNPIVGKDLRQNKSLVIQKMNEALQILAPAERIATGIGQGIYHDLEQNKDIMPHGFFKELVIVLRTPYLLKLVFERVINILERS